MARQLLGCCKVRQQGHFLAWKLNHGECSWVLRVPQLRSCSPTGSRPPEPHCWGPGVSQ